MQHNIQITFISFLFLAVSTLLVTSGCSRSQDQVEFERNAFRTPENFTRVSAGGIVDTSHIDESDWQIGPMFQGFIEVEIPAFPNPTRNERIEVELLTTGHGTIEGLYAVVYPDFVDERSRRLADRVERSFQQTLERIVLRIEPVDFSPSRVYSDALDINDGLHRLFIYDRNNNLITYGDIQLE